MGNISGVLANNLLDHIFGKSSYVAPANIFIAVSTTLPTDVGTNVTEPVGNSYIRKQTSPSDWNVAVSRSINNAVNFDFAAATGSWGTLGWVCLYTLVTGGVFMGWGPLETPQAIVTNDILRIKAGEAIISITSS